MEGFFAAGGQRAEDEFLGAGFDVGGEAGEDGLRGADGEVVFRVLAGALGVGGFEAGQAGVVGVSEAEGEGGAVVVFVDRAAGFGACFADGLDEGGELGGGFGAGLPAGAVFGGAADGGFGVAADPEGEVALHGLGADLGGLELEVAAFVGDGLSGEEEGEDFQRLVCYAAAGGGVEVERLPFRGAGGADAVGGQQAAFGEDVDGGDLLGQEHGIAHGERDDVDAEFEAPGAAGQRRHGGDGFEDGGGGNDAVGLPEAVDAAGFAEIDPAPEFGRGGEGVVGEAQADGHSLGGNTHGGGFRVGAGRQREAAGRGAS